MFFYALESFYIIVIAVIVICAFIDSLYKHKQNQQSIKTKK